MEAVDVFGGVLEREGLGFGVIKRPPVGNLDDACFISVVAEEFNLEAQGGLRVMSFGPAP
ncbi:MAG: hypothetical protein IPL62_11960 [Caulobacteraceae bacterium]|nr:hypothetical protein [Caulobacteraceae bacterium]